MRSMLFTRRVSGPRVVLAGGEKGAFMKCAMQQNMVEGYTLRLQTVSTVCRMRVSLR